MWITWSTSSPAVMADAIAARSPAPAPSPTSRLLVSTPSVMATSTSRTPISRVPTASNVEFPVIAVRPTPRSANVRPVSAAVSSSSTTGSSGALACRTNDTHD